MQDNVKISHCHRKSKNSHTSKR